MAFTSAQQTAINNLLAAFPPDATPPEVIGGIVCTAANQTLQAAQQTAFQNPFVALSASAFTALATFLLDKAGTMDMSGNALLAVTALKANDQPNAIKYIFLTFKSVLKAYPQVNP